MNINTFIKRFKKSLSPKGYDVVAKYHTFKTNGTSGFVDAALFDSYGSLEYAAILHFDTENGVVLIHNLIPIGGCIDEYIIRYVNAAINDGLYGGEEK